MPASLESRFIFERQYETAEEQTLAELAPKIKFVGASDVVLGESFASFYFGLPYLVSSS